MIRLFANFSSRPSMLEVRNLYAGYGSVPVLRDISFAVDPGEILLIVGENGAGKSTLLRSVAGFIRPDSGAVLLEDKDITGWAPEVLAKAGLRLVLDGHQVFPELTVMDNLRLGGAIRSNKASFGDALENIFEVFPILRERLHQYARDLSGGQQQMLALGAAFLAQPRVLLCDEPSMGLAQALLPPILTFLKHWAEKGTAIVIVEQHIKIALSVANRALLIDRGEATFMGDAGDLGQSAKIAG
jgi:branched-chain amino acid transport system ATP-binding protein